MQMWLSFANVYGHQWLHNGTTVTLFIVTAVSLLNLRSPLVAAHWDHPQIQRGTNMVCVLQHGLVYC